MLKLHSNIQHFSLNVEKYRKLHTSTHTVNNLKFDGPL